MQQTQHWQSWYEAGEETTIAAWGGDVLPAICNPWKGEQLMYGVHSRQTADLAAGGVL